MSHCKRDLLKNNNIFHRYEYSDLKALRRAFRDFLRIEETAGMKGNDAAIVLLSDLRQAISNKGVKVLTAKQYEVVIYVLIEDKDERDAASKFNITQQAVHYRLVSAIKRIQVYLLTGKSPKPKFTKDETDELIELYNLGKSAKEIAIELDKTLRTVENKIRYLRKKKQLGCGAGGLKSSRKNGRQDPIQAAQGQEKEQV